MKTSVQFEKCLTFINTQLSPRPAPQLAGETVTTWRAITISRQAGSGGHAVAEQLAELLNAEGMPGSRQWTVFDRNLVEQVLEDHHLPRRLAQFMPEDRVSEIRDTIDEIFDLHPSSWTLAQQTAETILRLADIGNVILIGRGSNIVTHKLSDVFHVRLVGSFEKRVERKQASEKLSRNEAVALIRKEDGGRRRYVSKHFGEDVDNPLLYHLTVNTDCLPPEKTARWIFQAVLQGCGQRTEADL